MPISVRTNFSFKWSSVFTLDRTILVQKRKIYRCQENAQKKPPGFQIRKKYSTRCFRKFDRQYVGLYLFHLFIFWSKGKMLLFLKESWHSVDKGDYTLIKKQGSLWGELNHLPLVLRWQIGNLLLTRVSASMVDWS